MSSTFLKCHSLSLDSHHLHRVVPLVSISSLSLDFSTNQSYICKNNLIWHSILRDSSLPRAKTQTKMIRIPCPTNPSPYPALRTHLIFIFALLFLFCCITAPCNKSLCLLLCISFSGTALSHHFTPGKILKHPSKLQSHFCGAFPDLSEWD